MDSETLYLLAQNAKIAQVIATPYVQSFISSNQTPSAGASHDIASISVGAGTWLFIGRVLVENSNAALTIADFWISPTSTYAGTAFCSTTITSGAVAGGQEYAEAVVIGIGVYASPGTAYLSGYPEAATTWAWQTVGTGAPNATGIIGVQLL